MFFTTSRLFRKTYRTLEFVDRLHKSLQVRCIFVKSGVDTNDKGRWESILQMQSLFDQFVVSMYVSNIHAAQEGLLQKQMVFGTLSFGYLGQPIPGEITPRGKQRSRITIDSETSEIVKQIFHWYVHDRVSLDEIIRRLNDRDCPLPPRCTTNFWSRTAVRGILMNTRYRGVWKYGVMEAVYLPDKDYTRQRLRAEPLAEEQIEGLRIISDTDWFAAQERLADEKLNSGRTPNDGDRQSRPKILNGLLYCPEHETNLHPGGPYGKSMVCPVCRRLHGPKRPLYSLLGRKLAQKMICQCLSDLLRRDPGLVHDVVVACQQSAAALQRPDPRRLTELKADHERLTRAIACALRNPGESEADQAETDKTIREVRSERTVVARQMEALEAAQRRSIQVPTEAEVRADIEQLQSILIDAANGAAEDADLVREIIKLLTGGRIELFQQGERLQHRGWLQGRFTVRLLDVLGERAAGGADRSRSGDRCRDRLYAAGARGIRKRIRSGMGIRSARYTAFEDRRGARVREKQNHQAYETCRQ